MPVVFFFIVCLPFCCVKFYTKLPSLWVYSNTSNRKAQGFLLFFRNFLDLYRTTAEEETAYLSNLLCISPIFP